MILREGLHFLEIFSEIERRVAGSAMGWSTARKLQQRVHVHAPGEFLAIAAASLESFVHFAWKGFLHWPQIIGLWSCLIVFLHL